MKILNGQNLIVGMTLTLKKNRAAAYGMDIHFPHVTFVELQEKQGYKTPWVAAKDSKGDMGWYKPSDFI